jgi:hypothetical protein
VKSGVELARDKMKEQCGALERDEMRHLIHCRKELEAMLGFNRAKMQAAAPYCMCRVARSMYRGKLRISVACIDFPSCGWSRCRRVAALGRQVALKSNPFM